MEIPDELFDLYYETCDDFIDDNFGINCILSYGLKKDICPNCVFNPLTQKSSNTYKSGGPITFTSGICPYCNGEGYKTSDNTETIKLRVYFSYKDWVKVKLPINIKDGTIQTIGHAVDLPKIKYCKELRINLSPSYDQTFTLAGLPIPHGFKRDKYFIAYWEIKQ